MLTQRAQGFLATFERRSHVPTTEVETVLRDANVAVPPSWLDFHERYAGYLLDLGRDVAHLGLLFNEPVEWFTARKPWVCRVSKTNAIWGIVCADVHPSYNFTLHMDGRFMGGPSESFDIYLEQIACTWYFRTAAKFHWIPYRISKDPKFRERLLARPSLTLVEEASDRFTRVLMDDTYLLFDDPETCELNDVWERD